MALNSSSTAHASHVISRSNETAPPSRQLRQVFERQVDAYVASAVEALVKCQQNSTRPPDVAKRD